MVKQRVVTTPEEAGRAADEFGGEVVLKARASGLLHKTEVGAVKLGLVGNDRVRAAAYEMAERLAAGGQPLSGFVVQQQVTGGAVAAVCQVEPDLLRQRADTVGVGRRVGEGRRLTGLGGTEPFAAGDDGGLIGVRLGQGSAPSHGAGHQAADPSAVELLVAGV